MKRVRVLLSVGMLLSGYVVASDACQGDVKKTGLVALAAKTAKMSTDERREAVALQEPVATGMSAVAKALSKSISEYTDSEVAAAALRAAARVRTAELGNDDQQ